MFGSEPIDILKMVITAIFSLILGYAIFRILLHLLPKKLREENLHENQKIIAKAQLKRKLILEESQQSIAERLSHQKEEEEASLIDAQEDLKASQKQLEEGEAYLEQSEIRLSKRSREQEVVKTRVSNIQTHHESKQQTLSQLRTHIQTSLAQTANCDVTELHETAVHTLINDKQIENQRILRELTDDMNSHATKKANRLLDRILSRYSPEFVWPKASSHVEIPSMKIADLLADDQHPLLQGLAELTEGVEINLWREKNEHPFVIKLGGGYGIYKEAAKLTLENLIGKPPSHWNKFEKTYAKHKQALEQEALKLGRQATNMLQLSDIHEEIQKMIGALNWRTSYRQNQYHHSVEVAKLAGILAHELKVDPQFAKRCGLLHDIGKGIDYRIEGSHAVISGDYADRYGENRLICDTVMSHHNDLVLETTLSYVLKTADTLSGARPGARINLEEGYQIRLAAIDQVVKSFPGILKTAIMNGGREVHIDVHHKKVGEGKLNNLAKAIAQKIEDDVAFPGQIKVIVSRRYEATTVA